MKISLNEIKKYVKIPSRLTTDDLIKLIGSRLVEVEDVLDLSPKYEKAYIVKVIACEPIEGTHLHLCQIDAGRLSPEPVQVVCGAPNVRKGMLAVWLAPGAIVPQTYGEENFKLGVRKLRGHESNGMLAGLDELDLGDDHSGIVELNPAMDFPGAGGRNIQPGDSFAEAFELTDIILDIENKSLTHRPDTFGLIGFAREVAGILNQPFTEPEPFQELAQPTQTSGRSPASQISPAQTTAPGSVAVTITEAKICPRYTCAVIEMKAPTAKEKYLTPEAVFLAKSGMRSINKIVDLTNIIMLKTGQPLHAFDYDKFLQVGKTQTPVIKVRLAQKDEPLQLLDGKTIKCTPDDILITSNNIPVALAGAMGGATTEIDDSTTKVLLESATFSLYHLRKTQMHHGIFSEAITRFTKGQPAAITMPVLKLTISALKATPLAIADTLPDPAPPAVVKITTKEINTLLGTSYTTKEITNTLQNVGFKITADENPDSAKTPAASDQPSPLLTIISPSWRTDIHLKQDIIEEVGRLQGYDNIKKTLPQKPFIAVKKDRMFSLKTQIRSILSDNLKAHELLTYTFVNKKLQQLVGEDPKDSYEIVNSISPDLQVLRQSLTPSLLEKVNLNQKAGYQDFTLYEMNQVTKKSYGKTADKVPEVHHHLSVVTTADYYTAKALLEALMHSLHQEPKIQAFTAGPAYFEPLHAAEITINGETIGHLGEIRTSIAKQLKLKGTISAFEINLKRLLDAPNSSTSPIKLSKYPSVERDLTLKVPTEVTYDALLEKVKNALQNVPDLIYQITPASIYQKASPTKNISIKLTITSTKKTLESSEISAIMEEVIKSTAKLGATVV